MKKCIVWMSLLVTAGSAFAQEGSANPLLSDGDIHSAELFLSTGKNASS